MGGTVQAGPGGLPVRTITDHREKIIETFTDGLDAAIAQAKEVPFKGVEPARFEAEITFNFTGITESIKVRPALDLAAIPQPVAAVATPPAESTPVQATA